jgi:hypothetical protein
MAKKACIMCGEEKNGLDVREDRVIGAMRWVKRNITKNAKNYHMVVCKDDFLKYKKRREGYERKQIIYIAIGVLFLALLLLFANGRYLGAIFYGLCIILFMYLLSLISYIPALEIPKERQKPIGINSKGG